MKKLSAILVGMSLVAGAVMAAGPVTSVNAVGYNKIDCPRGKYVLVNSAFESIEGKTLYTADILGTSLPPGTSVFYYDSSGTPGYKFDNYSEVDIDVYGWSSNITYNGSMGFWITVPVTAPSSNYVCTLAGQVPYGLQSTNMVRNGYNLLGYPYTASVAWTNSALAKSAKPGDVLYVFDPVVGYTFFNYSEVDIDVYSWGAAESLIINPGMGFWYVASSLRTNIEVRPYNP